MTDPRAPDPRRGSLLLEAQATWFELDSVVRGLVVATLRNDAPAAEDVRRRAHDLLDQHLDLKVAGITAIRRLRAGAGCGCLQETELLPAGLRKS